MESLDIESLIEEYEVGRRDMGYAMPLARLTTTWKTVHESLSSSKSNVIDSSTHASIIRFSQVAVAHGSDIQALAVSHDIHLDLIEYLCIDADLAFKALSNLVTKNEQVIDTVWRHISSEQFEKSLVVLPTSGLLFVRNSLFFTESEGQFDRCEKVITSGIVSMILQDSKAVHEDQALRFALCIGIMDALFHEGFAQDCIDLSKNEMKMTDEATRSSIRTEVYRYLDQYTFQDKVKKESNVPFVLVSECKIQVDALQVYLDTDDSAGQGSSQVTREEKWTSASLLISALAALLSQSSAVPLLKLTRIQEVVESAVKALGLAHLHFPRSKGGRMTTRTESTTAAESDFQLPNFKRDCITIISNLSHGNRAVQDSVRDLGGLSLVLGQCNIDEMNPYLREHAMYCIRNLLDDNKENQDVVDSIKPVGVQQSEELTELGYSAEFKDGQVGVTQTAKIESINEE